VKRVLSIALSILICGGVVAGTAAAKGLDMAAPDGVVVRGSGDRYIAISPGIPRAITFVARIERQGGRLSRWWYLRGNFHVPAVAYDRTAGGLSADGRTLVLSRSHRSHTYPPRVSRFAILDTQRSSEWHGQGRPPRFRQFAEFVDLRGHFSFDAISPDGSTIYLIHHYLRPSTGSAYITHYEVRALDAKSGKLLPQPIVDPEEPGERMAGLPTSRATSPDGRWAYTLYDGDGKHEPFIHALDTVGRRAVCVDLPQLGDERNLFMLGLLTSQGGQALEVVRRRFRAKQEDGARETVVVPEPLLTVDARSFEVSETRASQAEGGLPWPPIALAALASLFGIAWVSARRRSDTRGKRPEHA